LCGVPCLISSNTTAHRSREKAPRLWLLNRTAAQLGRRTVTKGFSGSAGS
jgi:hypothetical protein